MIGQTSEQVWKWRWPIVIATVLLILTGIQLLRVNRLKEVVIVEPPRVYTSAGSLVNGQITISAGDFYWNRIDLNRPSKLVGSFRTPNIQSKVTVLVISENDFERWKNGADHESLVRTGFVPGGKVNIALVPGVYFLLIDNRQSEKDQQLFVDFSLER